MGLIQLSCQRKGPLWTCEPRRPTPPRGQLFSQETLGYVCLLPSTRSSPYSKCRVGWLGQPFTQSHDKARPRKHLSSLEQKSKWKWMTSRRGREERLIKIEFGNMLPSCFPERPAAKILSDQRAWKFMAGKGQGTEIKKKKHHSVNPQALVSVYVGSNHSISTRYYSYAHVIIIFYRSQTVEYWPFRMV